jgi:hypothetical protein
MFLPPYPLGDPKDQCGQHILGISSLELASAYFACTYHTVGREAGPQGCLVTGFGNTRLYFGLQRADLELHSRLSHGFLSNRNARESKSGVIQRIYKAPKVALNLISRTKSSHFFISIFHSPLQQRLSDQSFTIFPQERRARLRGGSRELVLSCKSCYFREGFRRLRSYLSVSYLHCIRVSILFQVGSQLTCHDALNETDPS